MAVLANRPRAGTIASRNGSATVAPRPRSIVRRGTCFPVMKDMLCLLACERPRYGCAPATVVAAVTSALFILNAGALTIPGTNAEKR